MAYSNLILKSGFQLHTKCTSSRYVCMYIREKGSFHQIALSLHIFLLFDTHAYVPPPTYIYTHIIIFLSSYTNLLILYKLIIEYSAHSFTFCSSLCCIIFFSIIFYIFYSVSRHLSTYICIQLLKLFFFAH